MDYKYLHEDELEASILGSMLVNRECALEGAGLLTIDDFYRENKGHREVIKAILELNEEKKTIDSSTVVSQLKLNKVYDEINGFNLIQSLMDSALSFSNFSTYIERLQEFTLLRRLVEKCEEIVKNGSSKEINSISDFLKSAENDVSAIVRKRKIGGFKEASDVAKEVNEEILKTAGNRGLNGLSTGFIDLDKQINGFGNEQLICIAARPGVGKSALALNMCYRIAMRDTNNAIAYFSLEMSNNELMKRLFSVDSGVPQDKINKAMLNKDDRLLLSNARDRISKTSMYFEENTGLSIDDIVVKCRKLKEKRPDLCLIVIDHIGLIKEGIKKFKSDQDIIQYNVRTLKSLALELKVPIIIVAHINRDAEKKDLGRNRRPELSELRGSGEIENSCDKVLLLYRTSYYKDQGINTEGKKNESGDEANEENESPANQNDEGKGQKMEVIVAKNRQGAMGKINLLFFPTIGRFDNFLDEEK